MSKLLLTKTQIEKIPVMLKTMYIKDVAKEYKVHRRTIDRWILILRSKGQKITLKPGRRAVL